MRTLDHQISAVPLLERLTGYERKHISGEAASVFRTIILPMRIDEIAITGLVRRLLQRRFPLMSSILTQ